MVAGSFPKPEEKASVGHWDLDLQESIIRRERESGNWNPATGVRKVGVAFQNVTRCRTRPIKLDSSAQEFRLEDWRWWRGRGVHQDLRQECVICSVALGAENVGGNVKEWEIA